MWKTAPKRSLSLDVAVNDFIFHIEIGDPIFTQLVYFAVCKFFLKRWQTALLKMFAVLQV